MAYFVNAIDPETAQNAKYVYPDAESVTVTATGALLLLDADAAALGGHAEWSSFLAVDEDVLEAVAYEAG